MIDDAQAAAIGGSITLGSAATDTTLIYHQLLGTYLRNLYLTKNTLVANAGVSATGSTYGLIRLQTDVIDLAPELVIIDFAVNDQNETYYQAAAEALVRRLRTALPNAKLLASIFLEVANPVANDPTNVKAAVATTWKTICDHYTIPYGDFAAEVARAVGAAEHTVLYYMSDTVHPTNAGHATAATLLEAACPALFVGAQVTGDLPARLYADTEDYENTPIVRDGIDNDGETGTGWATTDGTHRESSTADDTITYTGTFQMILRDFQIKTGVISTKVDDGGWFNTDIGADGSNYRTHWIGTRGVHTVIFKVVSGTVELRRFLAI